MKTGKKLDFLLSLHGGKEPVKARVFKGVLGDPVVSIDGGLFNHVNLSASQIGELLAMFQELDASMRSKVPPPAKRVPATLAQLPPPERRVP
jgi:hypothetical protein